MEKVTYKIAEKLNINDVLFRMRIKPYVLQFDFDEYTEEACLKIAELYNRLEQENLIDLNKYPFEILLMQKRIETQTFSNEELKNLAPLCKLMKRKLVFADDYYKDGEESYYSFSAIKRTNKIINNLVNEIKSKNLSPAEQYAYACIKITQKPYQDFDSTLLKTEKLYAIKRKFRCSITNTHLSRSVNGVCNSDYIVCAGYANLLASVCSKLGIECYTQGVLLTISSGEKIPHRFNIAHIKDDKYGINGWQGTDLTHFRKMGSDKKEYCNLNFLFYPLKDVEKVSKRHVEFYENMEEDRRQFIVSPLNEIVKKGILKSMIPYSVGVLKGIILNNYHRPSPAKTINDFFDDDFEMLNFRVNREFDKFLSELIDEAKTIPAKSVIELYNNTVSKMEEDEKNKSEQSVRFSIEFAKRMSDEDVSLDFRKLD